MAYNFTTKLLVHKPYQGYNTPNSFTLDIAINLNNSTCAAIPDATKNNYCFAITIRPIN